MIDNVFMVMVCALPVINFRVNQIIEIPTVSQVRATYRIADFNCEELIMTLGSTLWY